MQISEIYLPQVGSSDELTYFLTYLYLFSDKYVKYQLRIFFGFPDAPPCLPVVVRHIKPLEWQVMQKEDTMSVTFW